MNIFVRYCIASKLFGTVVVSASGTILFFFLDSDLDK
jgi:hypothetical protein